MNISFNIYYKTHFGQSLILEIRQPDTGSKSILKMNLIDAESGHWQADIVIPDSVKTVKYRYSIEDSNNSFKIEEWGDDRQVNVEGASNHVVFDSWRSASDPRYALFSKAIGETILSYNNRIAPKPNVTKKGIKVIFKIAISRIDSKHRVVITGSNRELGNWDIKQAVEMHNQNHPVWEAETFVNNKTQSIEYKYCIIDRKSKKTVFSEDGANRVVNIKVSECKALVININDEHFNYPTEPWKCAGVAIPVFSLRRKNGCGVGEFSDIKLLVDWALKTGMKIIQILPVNDTIATHTWMDSYPYSGISVYALHPIYINISLIGKLKAKVTQQIIDKQSQYLNGLERVDYEAVMRLKSRFFKQIYDEQKRAFLKEPEYIEFFEANKDWLKPYAAFSYLRDLFNTVDFLRWGKYSSFSPAIINEICDAQSAHFDDVAIHYFIQYHAHKQLLDAANYARKKGVALKGDIPIGIYRNSVDAWVSPELYNIDAQAGAPPDDFSVSGQNWRFPTYNWDRMQKDNYKWWQQRLQKMADYFDAFRIDHILGFFRIWEIPENQIEGLLGRFNPSLPFSKQELLDRGMWFDYDRLCRPYIRRHFLYDIFGADSDEVIARYLDEYAPNCYNLKPQYNNQKSIEKALATSPDSDRNTILKNDRIKCGLFELVSEVILLEAPNSKGEYFVPRHSMHNTRSYRELDDSSKEKLNKLYYDYFYKRNEEFWASNAMKKLPTIKKATSMLLCGEDLGMVPRCVPEIMNQLGILSLEIQRMPKQPDLEFAHPNNYPYLSVASTSSHDTSTLRGWWEEDSSRSQRFFNNILWNRGNSPFYCETWLVKQIIEQHLHSPSMLAIFPLQDILGLSEKLRYENAQGERINQPANPNNYWRYRMHLCLEDLIEEQEFNAEVKSLIDNSERNKIY
ncbi:MAG: 4-alpha-glucanotransferase [Salinivirgaceae bacterium]|jgi:4-alpha-glucanotransferase|nr:4-alpha-glucanotransferase [Bacteroidales bacterium]